MTRKASRGMILVGAIMVLLVLAILTPALVYLVQVETKTAQKQKGATKAFYAAEAGIDRAVWYLQKSTANFDDILDGNVPVGYKGDLIYTDITDGAYLVHINSTSASKEVRVESRGRDSNAKEFRRIEAYFTKNAVIAAIYAPAVTTSGGAMLFWGPMMSKANLALSGSGNKLYPRKLARGKITAAGYYGDRDTSSAAANTDGREWWSYNESPGVPDPPAIDMDYYRTAAKAETGCTAGGTPEGSCYYTANQSWANYKSTTSRTYYFEANATFTGTKHFRGYMFVFGDLAMTGNGKGADGGVDYGTYIATIPVNSYKEYQKNHPGDADDCLGSSPAGGCGGGGDGNVADDSAYNDGDAAESDDACCHQYPGDGGYQSTETWKFVTGCTAHTNLGGATNEPVHFKGLIYVNGNTSLAGATNVHGSILSESGSFTGSGGFSVYFDDSLEVQVTQINFTRTSWKELPGMSF